jgi:hemolysin activation/secretion protein
MRIISYKSNLTRRLLIASAVFLFLPHVANAADAQGSVTDPGRIGQQLAPQIDIPNVQPEVEVTNPIMQQMPEGAETITFQLTSVVLEGVTAYKPKALEALYADKLGTTVSLADVYAIASALTTKYRNDGYILSQVIIPPQTIESGIVRLQVVEGYIDQITVEGQDKESAVDFIRQYAGHIKTGQALNVRDLERYLLLINDLPGVEARSVLSPSESQTGASDLRIIVTRDPFDALLSADNFGTRYLGPVNLSAAASLNSFFGMNERITTQYVIAPNTGEGPDLSYLSLGYEQPVGSHGTVLELTGSRTNTQPEYDLRLFNIVGRSDFISVKATHPFIRSRSKNLTGSLALDWRDVISKNIIDRREDRIRALRFGGRYEYLDTWLGVGLNSFNLELSKGLDILNASNGRDANLSRSLGDPQFFKANLDIQRLQRVTSEINLLLQARGQLANDALLSSEEFGIGGQGIGRGYDASEIVGDEGAAGKLEVQWNEPKEIPYIEKYQLFAFYEGGSVWNKDATTSNLKRDTITSTGVGVRADFNESTSAGVTLALPLNRDVQTMRDQDKRLFMNVSRKF